MCIKITRENIEILILIEVLIKINTFHIDKFFHIGTMQMHVEMLL